MASCAFKHEPLDLTSGSIRLVEVLPNDGEGDVHCRIRNTDMSEKYTCISYVWGPPPASRQIFLNGKSFLVRDNIYDFLRTVGSQVFRAKYIDNSHGWTSYRFEFNNGICCFWIDALCIDQESDLEKNHQVQRMGRIFQNAGLVVSWLGSEGNVSSAIYKLKYPSSSWYGERQVMSTYRAINNASSVLLAQQYWTQAWITQEVRLARKVLFLASTNMISWEEMKDAAAHVPGSHHLQGDAFRPELMLWSEEPLSSTLLSLMEEFRNDAETSSILEANIWQHQSKTLY